jgi:hypothetical protein
MPALTAAPVTPEGPPALYAVTSRSRAECRDHRADPVASEFAGNQTPGSQKE